MRVIVVGAADARERTREQLEQAGIEVVAELASLDAAQASAIASDAIVIAGAPRAGRRDHFRAPIEALTPREVQVLELLAEGLPNKLIAERLEISDQTVKFHVSSISGKLGAANRTDAVRLAVRQGLITL